MIHWWFIGDSLVIHWWFIGNSLVIHWWFIGDSLGIYWWFIGDSLVIWREWTPHQHLVVATLRRYERIPGSIWPRSRYFTNCIPLPWRTRQTRPGVLCNPLPNHKQLQKVTTTYHFKLFLAWKFVHIQLHMWRVCVPMLLSNWHQCCNWDMQMIDGYAATASSCVAKLLVTSSGIDGATEMNSI